MESHSLLLISVAFLLFAAFAFGKALLCGYDSRGRAEITRLRRALGLLGVPAQATKDPDKAPPLRVSVEKAREVMEIANG